MDVYNKNIIFQLLKITDWSMIDHQLVPDWLLIDE